MDYSVKIDEFEGPLDLLLHLIKQDNIDVYDISIDKITKQYMDYIRAMEELNINVASVYLVMASELMEIKSKMLLPNYKKDDNEQVEEEEVSRERLIEKLIEYQKYKEVSSIFKVLEDKRRQIYVKSPENLSNLREASISNDGSMTVDDLVVAFSKFLERKEKEKPLSTKVMNKEYSVSERKKSIREILKKGGKVEFSELFLEYNKSYIIVSFMAMLELAKEEEVNILQDKNFGNIYLELR